MLVTSGLFCHVIADFAKFILDDEYLRRTLTAAINDSKERHLKHQHNHPRNLQHLLLLMNDILLQPPVWTSSQDGLLGCPLNTIFRPLMNTTAGWAVFSRPDVNEHLRLILGTWAKYLESEHSTWCLGGENGWCASQNLKFLESEAQPNGVIKRFTDIFVCPNPSDRSTLGFKSWDDFFTRKFAPGVRSLAGGQATNLYRAILHPCEASMYRCAKEVKLSDDFWLKGQPYSIIDMLEQHWSSTLFENGTVYQAFLSALSYHRWHAPVSGTVVSIKHIPGSYFAQAPSFTRRKIIGESPGECLPGLDPAPPNLSQAYLSSVATRLLIIFVADCSRIGLVAFLAIGMADVSSCQSLVTVGQHVTAGDEIGMFHYGGSSYCLLFQERSCISLNQVQGQGNNPVKSLLASVDNMN
ncbi:hypothetical protein VTL71DRAFT_14840 [Oculimacula yallundae]|uniref:L-tryptophan decarboxylase PsiD-like domain-containing protein n=1 Tax=Oculimacula yallundae TaxID=86028 RepID=A0ABR4CF06_9HELO